MLNILQIKEIPFVLNGGVAFSNEVQVSFIVRLLHQAGNPTICLNTGARFIVGNNEELFRGGASIVAHIPNWNEICNSEEAIKADPTIKELLSYSAAFVSGQFTRFACEKGLQVPHIPYVETDKIITKMTIELFDPKQNA